MTDQKYDENKDDDIDAVGGMDDMKSAQSVPIKLHHDANKPTDVYPWFEITVQSIDVTRQQWEASVEIHLFWQDISLPAVHPKYDEIDFVLSDDDVPVKLSEVFENKLGENIETLQYKYFPETSCVYMLLVMQVTFVERMELQRFPLDRQFLGMDFNAWVQKGNWNWILNPPEWAPKEFHKQFCVRMLSSITEYEMLPPWVDFSADEQPLSIRLRVNRLPGFYFGSIILPNCLIVAAAFAAFPVDIDEVADRLSISVTLMLTAVAFRYVITEQLPKVTYLTIMDYYLLTGFIMLTLLGAENGLCGIPHWDYDARDKVDKYILYIFGGIWTLCHIFWIIVLLSENFMRVTWERMDILDQDDEDEWRYTPKERIISRKQSKQVLDEWNKFKGKAPALRASVYAEEHPDLLTSDVSKGE